VRQVGSLSLTSKAITQILTTTERSSYKLYGIYEGVFPNRRIDVFKSGCQPTLNDCGDCKVYDNGASDLIELEVVLFWIKRPTNNTREFYDIVEETININTMICLTNAASPDMLWLKGTKNPCYSKKEEIPMKNSAIDLTVEYPDLHALKSINQDAVNDANSRIASVHKNTHVVDGTKEQFETGGINTSTSASGLLPNDVSYSENSNDDNNRTPFRTNSSSLVVDDISTLTNNEGHDEDITADDDLVSTMLPERVLKSEKQLVSALSNLNDLRKKVYELEIQVGGHRSVLRTFHYPDINLETPINKLRRTYINADDLPNLFSYEFKSALTCQVKVLTYMNVLLLL
jgi:hypothetical protein